MDYGVHQQASASRRGFVPKTVGNVVSQVQPTRLGSLGKREREQYREQKQKPQNRVKVLATIAAVSVAVACLALVYGVWSLVSANSLVEKATRGSQAVLVTTEEIHAGDVIDLTKFDVQEVPEAYRAEGLLGASAAMEIDGHKALIDMPTGTQIASSYVAGQDGNHLAAQLSEGMEALTLAVDEELGIGGLIRVNDRVRVLSVGVSSDSEVLTSTLCSGAEVLATGAASQDNEGVYSSITLAVTSEQADEIRAAQSAGQVSLVLLSQNTGEADEIAAQQVAEMEEAEVEQDG